MAQQIPRRPELVFGGVVTAGLPMRRPPGSAARCLDLRPLPKGGIRPRGGRTRVVAPAGGGRNFLQFYEFRRAGGTAGVYHLAQVSQGLTEKWQQITLGGAYGLVDIETMGSIGIGTQRPVAITTVRDKVFFHNGYGVRSSVSQPALSSWDGTRLRYVGLDAYCPSGNPTVAYAESSGGLNQIQTSVTIYVGLYNSATNHFSNGVKAGKLEVDAESEGVITVSNLSNLKYAYHAGGELGELSYVFYATIDGASVPYLILNAAGTDVHTVAVGSSSAALNLTSSADQGFILDTTSEMPEDNFPPRPMTTIAYANGRVYGALQSGGTGSASTYRGFSYAVTDKEIAAVVWSAASDDYQERQFVGAPEESWPYTNRKATPNGEIPLKIAASSSGDEVLVLTFTGSFLLFETADGTHKWHTISSRNGIGSVRSFVETPHGTIWLDNFAQLVILRPGATTLDVLSEDYAELLTAYPPMGTAADYLLDPHNEIDRYQIWSGTGHSVIHDFALARGQAARNMPVCPAYMATSSGYTTARTMAGGAGVHHLVASDAIWVQEAHPLSGQIPTREQAADGSYAEITGEWISQWENYGASEHRKEIADIWLSGDAGPSAALGQNAATLSYYRDLASTETPIVLLKTDQSPTDWGYKGLLTLKHCFYIKFRIILRGHSADGWTVYPTVDSTTANVPAQLYGTLAEVSLSPGLTENRV